MSKVFLGLTNISSQIPDLAHGYQANGVGAITAVYSNHHPPIINNNVDYDLSIYFRSWTRFIRPRRFRNMFHNMLSSAKAYKKFVFNKAVKECEIFHFMWNTFSSGFYDLRYLKQLNKKIVVQFVGGEVRWKNAMEQEFDSYSLHPVEYDSDYDSSSSALEAKLAFIRRVEKYADLVFASPSACQLSLRPYIINHHFLRLSDFVENTHQRHIPHIIHSPSNKHFKGTKYFIQSIDKLKHDVDFTFELLDNIPYSDAKLAYTNADILLGQLFVPGGGKQEKEALASGCVVLTNKNTTYRPDLLNSPIIDINIDNLTCVLRDIIEDHAKRQLLSEYGRRYVEQYSTADRLCKKIIDYFSGAYTFKETIPLFFHNHYIPESTQYAEIYNKWTKYVSKTVWYKNHINSICRDGLIF